MKVKKGRLKLGDNEVNTPYFILTKSHTIQISYASDGTPKDTNGGKFFLIEK